MSYYFLIAHLLINMQNCAGKMKATAAFMTGKLKIRGDMGKAMKLEKLMGALQSKL